MSDWLKNDETEARGCVAAAVAAAAAEVTALSEYEFIPDLNVHFDKTSGYCFKEGLHDFHHASTHYTYHFDEESSSWQCSYDPEWDQNIGCAASLDAFLLLSELVDRVEISETTNTAEDTDREAASSPMDDILPCIRAIVLEAEDMPYGHLFIITVDGAAIACNEDSPSVSGPSIVDLSCNMALCRIRFNSERRRFQLEKILTEGGEEEGELVENRSVLIILNDSVIEREIVDVTHQDRLVVDCGDAGFVMLSLHIHQAFNTCAGCEPGLLLSTSDSHFRSGDTFMETTAAKSKADLERDRRRELKRLKKKYALSHVDYVQNEKPRCPESYTDRADVRRKTVGSDLPESAVEAMDARQAPSNSIPVSEENRGYKMLEKMGWKRGAGVGKREDGIQQPICPVAQMDSSGLGASSAVRVAVGDESRAQKRFKWLKAASRYAKIENNAIFD